jgi:hypothetical protein
LGCNVNFSYCTEGDAETVSKVADDSRDDSEAVLKGLIVKVEEQAEINIENCARKAIESRAPNSRMTAAAKDQGLCAI